MIAALRRQTVRLLAVLEDELLDLRCGASYQRRFVAAHRRAGGVPSTGGHATRL